MKNDGKIKLIGVISVINLFVSLIIITTIISNSGDKIDGTLNLVPVETIKPYHSLGALWYADYHNLVLNDSNDGVVYYIEIYNGSGYSIHFYPFSNEGLWSFYKEYPDIFSKIPFEFTVRLKEK